jgi:hypothetical protein
MPRACGVSSTPRPLGSITAVSGYWIARFLSRAMMAGMTKDGLLRRFRHRSLSYGGQVAPRNFKQPRQFQLRQLQTQIRGPAARCTRVVRKSFAQVRAWGMPGARCTRSLACEM